VLFRRKMDRYCVYCQFAGKIGEDSMICQKFGVVPAGHSCRHFRYDPLKRVPGRPKAKPFEQFDDKDFRL
jgi:hypothetical protein